MLCQGFLLTLWQDFMTILYWVYINKISDESEKILPIWKDGGRKHDLGITSKRSMSQSVRWFLCSKYSNYPYVAHQDIHQFNVIRIFFSSLSFLPQFWWQQSAKKMILMSTHKYAVYQHNNLSRKGQDTWSRCVQF